MASPAFLVTERWLAHGLATALEVPGSPPLCIPSCIAVMKIQPYAKVDDLAFSIGPQGLMASKGAPLRSSRNGVGLTEMDYGDSVFRFQDCGRLEEVTKRAAVIQLPHASVPFQFLEGFVRTQDPMSFERVGFVVSPKFGLAFAPAAPDWVTALAEHCIVTWRSLR
jgi:hypothetical protein